MALYVRHSAWLDAIPEREGKSNLPANTVSRRKAMEANGNFSEMPPLDCGDYLIRHLYDIGPTIAAGMGSGPVTYSEIEAWQRVTGIHLLPWEAGLLRRLSGEYAAESYAATKRDRPAPFAGPLSAGRSRQSEIDRKLSNFLG